MEYLGRQMGWFIVMMMVVILVNTIETNLQNIGKEIRIKMWPVLTTNIDQNLDQFILDKYW
jgi:hypothetical protein